MKYSLRAKHKNSNFESKDKLKNYVQIWFSLLQLGEFTENMAGHILSYMDELSKIFFTKNEQGKTSFPFWNTKFGTPLETLSIPRNIWLLESPAG